MARPDRRPLAASTRLTLRAALGLRRALLALADGVVPPQLALFDHAMGLGRTQLLHTVARLRVPDLLDAGPRSAAELARAAGVDADTLFRVLRALAALGVFDLRPDGRFENNRLSRAFRSDVPATMRDFLEYLGSGSNVSAWADVDRTVATGRSAFERVHGAPIWDWLARHPDEERTFTAAMMSLTELAARDVATGYPFGELARICDVAGGHGTLLAEILLQHRRPRGILFDAPQVVARAPALLARRGVADRVECVGGSFFDALPPGCDGYVLKDVLHDWDDAAARRILEVCRRAAPAGARVIVVELLLDRRAAQCPGVLVDVQMLMVTEQGRQRSSSEHHHLMSAAGFRPGRVIPLPGPVALIEGIAA